MRDEASELLHRDDTTVEQVVYLLEDVNKLQQAKRRMKREVICISMPLHSVAIFNAPPPGCLVSVETPMLVAAGATALQRW